MVTLIPRLEFLLSHLDSSQTWTTYPWAWRFWFQN